jgi:hypothetical protein
MLGAASLTNGPREDTRAKKIETFVWDSCGSEFAKH